MAPAARYEREALRPGPDRRLQVAGLAVADGEAEEERRPASIVEVGREATRLLEVGQRAVVHPGARLDRREGHEHPELEIGLDGQAAAHALEERRQEAARIGLVVGLVQAERHPVAGQGLVGGSRKVANSRAASDPAAIASRP